MDRPSLKPELIIAEVLPGFTVLAVLAAAYFFSHHDRLMTVLGSGSAVAASSAGL